MYSHARHNHHRRRRRQNYNASLLFYLRLLVAQVSRVQLALAVMQNVT